MYCKSCRYETPEESDSCTYPKKPLFAEDAKNCLKLVVIHLQTMIYCSPAWNQKAYAKSAFYFPNDQKEA